jgi:hypothetical protein
MSTLIISKQPPAPILYARIGVHIEGNRYLHVCRKDADGREFDEWSLLEMNDHPMAVVPNLGGDLDDAMLKDFVQSSEGRKAARRIGRPDVTALYHEMNEQRAAELKGQRVFAVGKNED